MPIDPLYSSPLIAALRAELSRKGEKVAGTPVGAARTAQDAKTNPRDINALRRELAEILKDVSPTDTAAMDAVRPRVVRAVLLWEFGSELREHSQWQPMLERLVATLESNEHHREDFVRMIRDLRA